MAHAEIHSPDPTHTDTLMRTETVPPNAWPDACADFSRTHHGWLVQVRTLPTTAVADGDRANAKEIAADLPLAEVAAVAADPLPNIDIRVGDQRRRTVQRVERPQSLKIEKDPDGAVMGLRIDDTDGVTTLVHFRTVMPTQRLDGLAASEH
ncbi:MAG: hypothetical protein GVY09_13470 [Gammaproteobacteria bacterium]|jgi:hypothetical protein|nr:hypothetical protein [Gammaproteobacteria bacterium]